MTIVIFYLGKYHPNDETCVSSADKPHVFPADLCVYTTSDIYTYMFIYAATKGEPYLIHMHQRVSDSFDFLVAVAIGICDVYKSTAIIHYVIHNFKEINLNDRETVWE